MSASSFITGLLALLLLYPATVGLVQISNGLSGPESGQGFPDNCEGKEYKCARIAPDSHRSNGEMELRFNNTSVDQVLATFDLWVDEQPRTIEETRLIDESSVDIHVVIHTQFLSYADDLYVHIECNGDDAVVWLHSSSRFGVSDLGVNPNRILDIHSSLISVQHAGTPCS
ncbi:MAG TPA: DUF1499 domain-containing protein [Candidatus Thalassarchaeaceae archaeon]|nr:MAG TPA: DUF1499 domain-containing protein [Candidatus Poseidoniales archaeon]HIH84531.1 DUF1499 domain-containing protein [Candidatus Thalassarchaeaceae archaeon]|tara:strand:+ start:1008 stop:1520 length:513 start_codon:yes stop_codon:yes gene_type:complete